MEDLFEIRGVRSFDEGKLKLKNKKQQGFIQFIGRTRSNNGIKGYVKKIKTKPNSKNTISISQIGTIVAQIRTEEWYASQNIFSLTPKDKYKQLVSIFGLTSINKALSETFSSGYSNYPTLDKLNKLKIQLPTKNSKIDFDFMENFIVEQESYQIIKLRAYLKDTGLENYNLTSAELKALGEFESEQFEQFNVTDIFTVKNSGNILSRDIVENSGDTPYLCAGRKNNSINSYISYDTKYLDNGNCIFIGGKTFVVTYQEFDFYSNDSHNLILYLKNNDFRNKLTQLYLASCINKSLRYKYSWGDSISNKKIQNDYILLPVKNNQPDFSLMKIFISAIQKLVIKDVVLYADKKIATKKQVINKSKGH